VIVSTMPDDPAPRRLHIALTDGAGRAVRIRGLAAWLRRVAPARAHGALCIALVGDRAMQRLNREFAGKNKATDVLSFPACLAEAHRARADRAPGERGGATVHAYLGDIVIATGVARRQARAAKHPYARELRVLALHGLLHLLGYDHETDDGAMARVEARLRRKGGLATGVIERARTA
jgi:probable rRNA maturation factor